MTEALERRQHTRFMWLYALAAAGGAVAYVPFLTILFPVMVTRLVGPEDVSWLAYASFIGAITASLANIGFGWISDITKSRRLWIIAGMLLSCAALPLFGMVDNMITAIFLLIAWQAALNMMLAPIAAWAGDSVPDRQKGFLGGLLAFAPAAGALAGALVTMPGLADGQERLWLVSLLVALCVLPVLIFGRPVPFPELMRQREVLEPAPKPTFARQMVGRMWFARLAMQIAEAALFAYIYFWLRSVDPALNDARVAQIFGLVLFAAVPLALLTGRWADRRGRPFLPLVISALIAATGLAMMAVAQTPFWAIASYTVFGLSAAVFLALHTAQTLRVLPQPRHRGRDLGIFNLTNTGPSLIMPWLTLAVVPGFGFGPLFAILSGCALMSALLLARIPAPD